MIQMLRRYGYAISLVLLSTFILVRAISDARIYPPDCDEKLTLGRITDPEFKPAFEDFINQGFHPLATYLSRLSVQAFGNSLLASRIPTLVVTFLFLSLFSYFSWRYLSPWAGLLVLIHFAANEVMGWYFHSNRGYQLMVSMSFVSFAILWRATLEGARISLAEKLVFLFCFGFAITAHLMAGPVTVFLAAAFTTWWWLHRKTMKASDEQRVRQFVKLCFLGLVPVVIFSLIGIWNLWRLGEVLTSHPNLRQSHFYELIKGPLGVFKDRWIWLLSAATIAFGVSEYRQKRLLDFPALVTAAMLVGFSLLLVALKMHSDGSRYFLAVPLFVFIWWGQSVSRLRPLAARYLVAGVFVFVLIVAVYRESHPELVMNMCRDNYQHASFITRMLTGL